MAQTPPAITETNTTITDPFPDQEAIINNTPITELPPTHLKEWHTNLQQETEQNKQLQKDLATLAINPTIEQYVLDELHKTISHHDDHVIKLDLYTGVSTFYHDPLNTALKCESGSGKTYSTVQTLTIMPPENVQMIGSQSPKVISHENGRLLDKNGKEITDPPTKPRQDNYDDKEQYRDAMDNYIIANREYQERIKESYYEVILSGKIFTFLEGVNIETFKMIKSTLSHDNETIDHKYVDDHGKVHITRLIGYPACIFNSLDNEFMSEFATRTLTTTPTTSQPKIEHSKKIKNQKAAYPFLYKKQSYEKTLIQTYLRCVRDTIKRGNLKVIIPFPSIHQKFRSLEVRDMRDFNHFLELVPAITIFHLFQRPVLTILEGNYVIATIQDIMDAKALFDSISSTTQTSTEQKILTFYYECLKDKTSGTTANILTDTYNKNHKKVSTKTIQRWLQRLIDIEWVDAREGVQSDNRTLTFYPLQGVNEDENQTQLDQSIDTQTIDKNRMSTDLGLFCQKDFDLWLKTIGQTHPPTRRIQLQISGSAQELSQEDFENNVRCIRPHVCPIKTEPKISPKPQNPLKTIDNQKMSNQNVSIDKESTASTPIKPKESITFTPPTQTTKKKKWYIKHIPPAEQCGICQTRNVTEEISGLTLPTPIRRCSSCLEKMKHEYKTVEFLPAYPDESNTEETPY